jgi:hypothetical protein
MMGWRPQPLSALVLESVFLFIHLRQVQVHSRASDCLVSRSRIFFVLLSDRCCCIGLSHCSAGGAQERVSMLGVFFACEGSCTVGRSAAGRMRHCRWIFLSADQSCFVRRRGASRVLRQPWMPWAFKP